jgi:putative ABC transport system ATP-binding protein
MPLLYQDATSVNGPMVRIEDLRFAYRDTGFALRIDELSIDQGASVAFIGPSGCGKTTLLNLISGIATPDAGAVQVDDTALSGLSDAARRAFRVRRIGLVFQEFELLTYLSVLDNILLPYRVSPALSLDRAARDRAVALAQSVGIGDKLRRRVRRLSQGERQRVAVCRALVTQPSLLLADEPTGNLDPTNKDVVLDILFRCAREADATLVVVTHDHGAVGRFDRVIDFARFHALRDQADDPIAGTPSTESKEGNG